MSKETKHGSRAAEGARRASGAGPEPKLNSRGGRWSAQRKMSVVVELLRGEDLETLSRKHGVTAATLTGWREAFLRGGEGGLKSRELDLGDEEKQRLKSVVANLSMDNELLREKIRHLEANRPLAWRRSKR